VLVVGGGSLPWGWMDDAEIYDPVADTWTAVPPLYSHGLTHTATLMRDGRVLVVGGNIGSYAFTERVEIFDPRTNSWTEAPPLAGERAGHTAELLEDGRVLIAGGQTDPSGLVGGDAVLYDPQANTWTATGPMVKPRLSAQSERLLDGRVLVAGGMALEDMPTSTLTASVEIYDPVSNTWSAAPSLSQPRYLYSLERLPNGQVLVVGGARDSECCWNAESFVRAIEVYDPVADQWRTVANLPQPRVYPATTRLSDGRIWLSGGRNDSTFMSDTWWLVDAQTAARLGLR
jgi:N-acetylneuraminic acid mutarotase